MKVKIVSERSHCHFIRYSISLVVCRLAQRPNKKLMISVDILRINEHIASGNGSHFCHLSYINNW